jgi:hypothetical protein
MSVPTSRLARTVCPLLILASMGMVGCATLIHGPSQEITVESTPPETPLTTVLKRDRTYSISIYHDGYERHRTTLRPGRSIWTAANALNLFVPGLLVDASTGAFHALKPAAISAELTPADSSAVEPPAPDGEQGGTP